ncbi:MAG TPA: aminopeptidase P N-terminal domain-containing protein [Terracidiphilus sp.]|jgi:Xaa-Pro aminopeptidase|nr:aminopeptidase P N-terminal domain-containing protein [Terracidiphilus sp.]
MKSMRPVGFSLLVLVAFVPFARSLEKQPSSAYQARREALAAKLQGGVAVLFAAPEPILDFMPYRQDSDFYYLTGWNEPGAALMVVGANSSGQAYKEILFLPTRNLRTELYTGVKMDAASPGVVQATGVDAVEPMTAMPADLNQVIARDRRLAYNLWTQPDSQAAKAVVALNAVTLGMDGAPPARDVTALTKLLREVKDDGEVAILKKASDASIAAQREMMRAVKPGVTERAIAGKMTEVWFQQGCERPSYAPIVGSGINSTTLHYAENSRTMEDGDVVVVDAACEYSMYASDITRTVPVNGHFSARQREIYNNVLGAQQAAIEAFVAGKSTINDRDRKDPNSLDTAAYNYINTHGKDLHGDPLGKYWLHGLGHMVGIDVHDPADYPAVLKPGMVFTIEPGVYIPEEKIGVRIECDFLVGQDGKLVDLDGALPHTADEVEAAMRAK